MCGIAGFVGLKPLAGAERTLRRMTDAIRHRGPDDAGVYEDEFAALGHRRLSIVDVSAAGHQPMQNENGSQWIVFNGEIFNHARIRPELERAGHHYRSRCDTETILHAYEELGPSAVDRFRGMFAFAIWDKERRRLFCARDRLGIKPFYYYSNSEMFAFASEIKALLEHPAIPAELEESVLGEYLSFGYISGEKTLFRGIRKLMPGHHLIVNAAGDTLETVIEQYWDVPVPRDEELRPDGDWISEVRRRLEETVELRLMSDVPLGMFLSGGVDSSAIAALMKPMVSGPVKTFAVGYRESQYSELSYAAGVARAIGTEHHEVTVSMEDFFSALPQLIWHEDEPITWPSSVSLHFVSRLAAEQVKVVLTGEGSDEIFGGYARYQRNLVNQRAAGIYAKFPAGLRDAVRRQCAVNPMLGADLRRKLQHTVLGRELNAESLYLDNYYAAFSGAELGELLAKEPESPYASYLRHWNEHQDATALRRMLYADQKTYLVELLMKQDQMSMSTSIESRVPFLDHHLVEFAMRIPDRLKNHNGQQKFILKKAVEDLLPDEIIYRKKMGFPTPLRDWLRDERAEPLFARLRRRSGVLASVMGGDYVEDLLGRHRSGREDATDRIWRLLNLQIWADIFLNGRKDEWCEPLARREKARLAV